ncbi:DUF418 domain-containing protein [Sphingomonas abietis]|uniref:DUF418 domain-containing protein n=1 Tax=Sphingomonas abietis TaxID=3012344 RepID=A0ABY7NV96_9SPHN|nr:DUF418 domain-containing protein [Sphingomonas abietis]WBO23376.1 DUF418 domain-containing protein [Sphingomonas abietis]
MFPALFRQGLDCARHSRQARLVNERHGSIDGLRGLAVMGILLMNVAGFALPSGAYFNPLGGGGTGSADITVWTVNFVLFDGKMRALFSILFGASTMIVVQRAEAAGLSGARVHLARMATLALFGAAHLFLIWQGDILLHYALIGTLALPFVLRETRLLIRVAILLLITQLAVQGMFVAGFATLQHAALLPGADKATIEGWRAFTAGVGIGDPRDVAVEIARMRGPWSGIVAANLANEPAGIPFLIGYDGPETLAYMLIGMAALRSGLLTGAWPRARYARAAAIGFAIGLPPTILLCWLCFRSGFDTLATFAAATLGGVLFRPILAVALAALALAWLTARDHPRLRAVGRMAFSNYLGTSLLMTGLFYGWGFGLFAQIERIWLYPIVCAVWVLMLSWSPWWLARFRYGPLEWAWRSLARGQIQTMRLI